MRVVVAERASGLVASRSARARSSPFRERRLFGRAIVAVRPSCWSGSSISEQISLPSIPSAPAIPRFAWIARRGAGRILRAPTLFEDAVKVLATTNCTWGLTKLMVTNLIERFDRGGAFPDARVRRGTSRARARGARSSATGRRISPRSRGASRPGSSTSRAGRTPARPDEEVEKEIRAEKGFGPYAADTLGRLLGRHAQAGPRRLVAKEGRRAAVPGPRREGRARRAVLRAVRPARGPRVLARRDARLARGEGERLALSASSAKIRRESNGVKRVDPRRRDGRPREGARRASTPSRGFWVTILGRSPEKLDALVADLSRRFPVATVHGVVCDLARRGAARARLPRGARRHRALRPLPLQRRRHAPRRRRHERARRATPRRWR